MHDQLEKALEEARASGLDFGDGSSSMFSGPEMAELIRLLRARASEQRTPVPVKLPEFTVYLPKGIVESPQFVNQFITTWLSYYKHQREKQLEYWKNYYDHIAKQQSNLLQLLNSLSSGGSGITPRSSLEIS